MDIGGVPIDPNMIAAIEWFVICAFFLIAGWAALVAVWAIGVQAGRWSEQVDTEKRFIGHKVQADTDLYQNMKALEYQKAKELQDMELQEQKIKRKLALAREEAHQSLVTGELKAMADENVSPVVPISSKSR